MAKLRRKSIQESANATDHSSLVNGLLWIEKSRFLSDLAKFRFSIFERSKRSQNKRIAKDNAILDECISCTPPLIAQSSAQALGLDTIIPELSGTRANDAFVRVTGHGNEFSDLINFLFVHFPAKYKWAGVGFTTACGLFWLYFLIPYFFPWACQYLTMINWCVS